ncbi:MAG: ankyrin repeat domain-containing protein [Verrucomicrobiota bacterium]
MQAAQRLIEAGANPNATNQYGIGPLSLACQNGNTAMVKLLLAAGANPNASLAGGETMLLASRPAPGRRARWRRSWPLARTSPRKATAETAMMWAAAEGHAGIVDLLLKEELIFKQRSIG